ncbi:MAG: hypothetical protein U0L49_10325 [Eubacterium sp.]|nr:hypothetical protein [Eubacterium sp.]
MKERIGLKELKQLAARGVKMRAIGEKTVDLDSLDLLESCWSLCESGNYMSDIQFDQAGLIDQIDFNRVGPPPKKRAVRF